MAYVVVDTDVSSQILRDRLPPTLAAKLVGKTLCATFVTVAELTQWAEIHRWGAHRKLALTQWLASLLVLPYNEREDDTVLEDVARTWGEISARARLRGRPRPQNDTWIAATCLVYGLPLQSAESVASTPAGSSSCPEAAATCRRRSCATPPGAPLAVVSAS